MLQQLQLQPISAILEDLSSSPLIRFYLQEECFLLKSPNQIENAVQLPFNQVVTDVVTQATLASKSMSLNSRLNTNLLENGREIYHRKKQYFQSFLKEYQLIGQTLVYLPSYMREIITYTICALSNLILKLSINMAKISIVVITKILTPPYFNVFMVAILFQKFLGRQLLKVKEGAKSPQQTKNLVRQFPRQTILKLSKRRNPYDFYYITKCQNSFSSEACNIQLIELFEEEEQIKERFTVSESKRGQRFNLQKLFGLQAPFGMELYLFFMQTLIEKMYQFKPDVIIFIEELDQNQVKIDPVVKGLIVNELSTRVQNKIYILKEFGPTPAMMDQLLSQQHQSILPQITPNLKIELEKAQQTNSSSIIDAFINLYQDQTIPSIRSSSIQSLVKQHAYAQEKITNDFQSSQLERFRNKKLFLANKSLLESGQSTTTVIQKMRKHLFDDVANLSVSLIQKSNFQEAIKKFRAYTFGDDFLSRLIFWMQTQKQKIDGNLKIFSDVSERLKNKIDRLNGTRQLSLQTKSSSDNTFSFYNVYKEEIEYPVFCNLNGQRKSLPISKQDSLYIHYTKEFVMLFHFDAIKFSVFKRNYSEQLYTCVRQEQYATNQYLAAKNSTLIGNSKYFYKAFGQFEGELGDRSLICRINIEQVDHLPSQQWDIISYCNAFYDNKLAKVNVQQKILGWGESLDVEHDNWVIFGGGYNFAAYNEQRVNKCLYLIKNHSLQVLKVGKGSSQVINEIESIKLKLMVHPFVYGVPLSISNSQLVVLNTNGYFEHLNHHKRLYLTKYKLPSRSCQFPVICTVSQNKMVHEQGIEETISYRNAILSWIHAGYLQVNRYQGVACFYDSNGHPIILRLKPAGMFQNKDVVIAESKKKEQTGQICLSFECARLILREEKKKQT